MKLQRRSFLKSGIAFTGVWIPGQLLATQTSHTGQDKPVPLAADLVKDFVIAGHGNLIKVKEMLEQQPNLLNATWDWGGGDYETAIGGAGHVGNLEIAEYLIERGARFDIFVATMLGKLDVVKQLITTHPNLKSSKGPHGLMLKHHAQKGGEPAKLVLDYLVEIGAE
jgi:hypothetical protein